MRRGDYTGRTWGCARYLREATGTRHRQRLHVMLCDRELGGCGQTFLGLTADFIKRGKVSCGCKRGTPGSRALPPVGEASAARDWNRRVTRKRKPTHAFVVIDGTGSVLAEHDDAAVLERDAALLGGAVRRAA